MSATTDSGEHKTLAIPVIKPRINTAAVTPNNVGSVRKLNSVIFPVKYSDSFYKGILSSEVEDFCRLIYFNDIPVGTVCCRAEKGPKPNEAKLYMMTMGVLAPYRNFSVGSLALTEVLAAASSATNSLASPPPAVLPASSSTKSTSSTTSSTPTSHPSTRVTHVYVHVQVSNTDARRFYERHGFKLVKEIPDYYKKIEPRGAWMLEKEIEPAAATTTE